MTTSVLHIVGTANVGGTERQLLLLLDRLDRRRFAPRVALIRGGPLVADFAELAPTVVLDKRGKVDPRYALRLLRAVGTRPDLVHTWLPTANLWGGSASITRRAPRLVLSERALPSDWSLARRSVNRAIATRASAVVANSRAVAQGLLDNGYPRPKVHIIPNAVEVENSVGTGSRVKERILLLGRLDPIKGHDILLEALPSLTQQFPSISVIFAGPAALPEERRYEEYLRRLALRLGVDDRVTVSGFVNPSRTLLREAAVVVVPSRAEGCPNVVLEAMAEMAPVVATRVGGTPEVVTDGVTGLLVDSECPEALGAGIARLLDRPDEAAERAEQAFEHVRRLFSPEAMVAAWEALYDEL